MPHYINSLFFFLLLTVADDNIDETYGVNVQFESDEEVSDKANGCSLFLFFEIVKVRGPLLA